MALSADFASRARVSDRGSARWADRAALAAVLFAWLCVLAWAVGYVVRFGPRFPFGDETELWDLLPPSGSLSWRALWSLKNEHRVPLPRLLHYAPYALFGDLRAPMLLEVALLAGAAWVLVAAARRIRGRTVLADTLFPVLWLNTGNWFNLLSGFQISLMLPTAIAAAILAAIAASPARPGPARAAGIGAGLLCLPLCGGVGLIQLAALGAWAAVAGWTGRRSPETSERAGAAVLLGGLALALLVSAAYFVHYSHPHWYAYTREWSAVLVTSALVLAAGLGPAAAVWPAGGILAACTVAAALGPLATGPARAPGEGLRRLGFAASVAAIVGLALSIGVGRGDATGLVPRYFVLAAPLYSCAHLAWTAYGAPWASASACGTLALAAWATLPGNARAGETAGLDVRDRARRFEEVVDRGAGPAELVRSYTELFPFHFLARSEWILESLAARRDPPFDRGRAPAPGAFQFRAFNRIPSSIECDEPVGSRNLDGLDVFVVHAGTAIHLGLAAGDSKIEGRFGVPSERNERRHSSPMRVRVEVRSPDGAARTLFDRTLDPASNEADRGSQAFELDELPAPPGEIVLRADRAEGSTSAWDWVYWCDVRIE